MPGAIAELARVVLEREMAKDPEQFRVPLMPASQSGGLSPDALATIGGLADAASTYAFLKRGRAKEGNALVGFTNHHPEATTLAAIGGLATTKGITALLRKVSPAAADAVAANLGALQLSYAVGNLGLTRSTLRSSEDYQRAMVNKVVTGR